MSAAATSDSFRPVCWEWSRSSQKGHVRVDRLAGHEDSLRLLDDRPSPERSLQVVILREALQGDVDCALQFVRRGVDDVGEDAAFGRLFDVGRLRGGEQRDHRAAGFHDDLVDHLERMFRGQAKRDERDVGLFACRHLGDDLDVDFARDHLVSEAGDDRCEQREPVGLLVCDEDAQVPTVFFRAYVEPRSMTTLVLLHAAPENRVIDRFACGPGSGPAVPIRTGA